MTATALHPSEITFICPPCRKIPREQHLDEFSGFEGTANHQSPDREGTGWRMSLCLVTYPDGTYADPSHGVEIELDAPSVELSPADARRLVQELIAAVAEIER